ncbi:MAG: hypothetical protein OXC28_21690 [Defluviicoccus sp.]|nr:hypothetical protein [Defluviicoccus sp.]
MKRTIIFAAAGLWAASAAAHPPDECRTVLAGFSRHAEAFAETRKVTRPAFARLMAAWDQIEAAEGHAGRHAAIYLFASGFPALGPQLAAELESSEAAMKWAARAIFCLRRER